jgi:hypothetical protein
MNRIFAALGVLAGGLSAAAAAEVPHDTYAQELLSQTVAANREIVGMTIDAIPPKSTESVVIASSDASQIGRQSAAGALSVAQGGKAATRLNLAGELLEVELPLLDVSGDTVGALSITYPKGAIAPTSKQNAERIRDTLRHRIAHVANLLDAYPYDSKVPSNTYAQQLVEATLAKHPDVLILALHATPPNGKTNIIIGSNIGRIGKAADEDDMRVISTGKPNLEVEKSGKRFEAEVALFDKSGARIGAAGIVFAYKSGDDQEALRRRGEQVAAEISNQILSAASLFESAPALKLLGRTELPGYSGDFDHFAVDVKGKRLFLAAEDHGTVEVFDLESGKHQRTLRGFETPHSILLIPEKNQILVTDGTDTAKLLDAKTLQIVGAIKVTPGADSIGYDPTRKHLYVVTGGKDVKMGDSWLTEIDLSTGERVGDVKFDANHVEAMAVEHHGSRLYINITDKNYMAVVDKDKRTVVARWPIHEAQQNAPVAFDEANHRLFVITRQPGKMIVLNAEDGSSIASFDAPGRIDEAIFDAGNHRIYAPGGEGYIGVYQQRDPDHYVELAHVPSAAGAKTAVLVPELHRLYVAVSPGEGKTGAALIWFDVAL